jgi:hypothetical protein
MKLLAAAAVTAAMLVPATPAMADTPACVSSPEVARIEVGMARATVHRIFDVKGKLVRLTTDDIMVRQYRMCTGNRLRVSYYGGHGGHWHLVRAWIKPTEI